MSRLIFGKNLPEETMRISVCDDEIEVQKILETKIKAQYPSAEVLCCSSGEELLTAQKPPDILFLDIQMQGKNGMETAKEIRKHNKNMILVFVTVIEDYVFQAFDVGAFHYLIKPFTDEKFAEVLQAAAEQYLTVSKNAPRKQEEKYLMINAGGTHFRVCLTQIVYAEVYGRKVMLHTANEDIEYYGRLSELEKEAGENFFRTHRAFLVNFKYIVKYNASEIQLEKGTALIAKKNYPQFVKAYLRYNQRRERD